MKNHLQDFFCTTPENEWGEVSFFRLSPASSIFLCGGYSRPSHYKLLDNSTGSLSATFNSASQPIVNSDLMCRGNPAATENANDA